MPPLHKARLRPLGASPNTTSHAARPQAGAKNLADLARVEFAGAQVGPPGATTQSSPGHTSHPPMVSLGQSIPHGLLLDPPTLACAQLMLARESQGVPGRHAAATHTHRPCHCCTHNFAATAWNAALKNDHPTLLSMRNTNINSHVAAGWAARANTATQLPCAVPHTRLTRGHVTKSMWKNSE